MPHSTNDSANTPDSTENRGERSAEAAWPRGAVPRIELGPAHQEFLRRVEPAYCMLDITDARRLVKRGTTASDYTPEGTDVVTTTTIPDEQLDLLHWEADHVTHSEVDIVAEFEPAFHIPTDYSVYRSHAADERVERVREHVRGVEWMRDALRERNVETDLIPLLKGETPAERSIVYDHLTSTGQRYAAVYVQQFFSQGNHVTEVEDLLSAIQEEARSRGMPGLSVLTVGLMSPYYLSRDDVPSELVGAAAGQYAWRSEVAPTTEPRGETQRAYREVRDAVHDALTADTR